MKVKRTLYSITAVFVVMYAAHAQEGALEFPTGARNASLVNANIAEPADISVMYENPAPLVFLEKNTVLLNHSQGMTLHGMQETLALPLLLTSTTAIALSLDAYHDGYVGNALPAYERSFEYGYDLALAHEIAPTMSLGAGVVFRRGAVGGNSQSWGAYYSVGADYAPTPDIGYGIVYSTTARALPVSPFDSGSVTVRDLGRKKLEVGGTMSYPSSASLRSPIVRISFANEKIFGTKGLYYKGGVEIRPMEYVALRFGYLAGPRVYSARYGLGITANPLAFQYAICPLHGADIILQQFSVSLEL